MQQSISRKFICTVKVPVNLKSYHNYSFNIHSWEDWKRQIREWISVQFPEYALISETNPWQELNAENYMSNSSLILVNIHHNNKNIDVTFTKKLPEHVTKYTALKHLIQQPLSKIDYMMQDKRFHDQLQEEVSTLLHTFTIKNKELLSGLVILLEKIYKSKYMNSTRATFSHYDVFDGWIIDIMALVTELPTQLQFRVKNLFHEFITTFSA
jgi:hypothetical protein